MQFAGGGDAKRLGLKFGCDLGEHQVAIRECLGEYSKAVRRMNLRLIARRREREGGRWSTGILFYLYAAVVRLLPII
jgi:hypothetical protein